MNLNKLFQMQKKLDDHIMDEHPELKGQNNLDWKILALLVELGECANEWRGFKKWSNDKEPRTMAFSLLDYEKRVRNPLLEEYVDCLHFILSIGLSDFKIYEAVVPVNYAFNVFEEITEIKELSITSQFNSLFLEVGILHDSIFDNCYTIKIVEESYNDIFRLFIGLGEMLGFTWEQVEQAYFSKNAVNHQRQEDGY